MTKTWIFTTTAVLLVAGLVRAADTACSGTPQTTINATTGSFTYCTPAVDSFGDTYPETGYPMTCFVREGATVLSTTANLGPLRAVLVSGLPLRFEHQLTIACSNSAGEGAAWAGPGRFPAAKPSVPRVVLAP